MTFTDEPTSPFYAFACPETHRPLAVSATQLESTETGRVFPIQDGIPNFLKYPPLEDEETVQRLQSMTDTCRKHGWQEAIKTEAHESMAYVVDETRARFLDLLPITKESRVLELGASVGQHTYLIAQRCASVHALEIVPMQALFASLRCSQLGCSNVRLACGGDDCRLPFFDEAFDVVVVNLVLEWCGARSPEKRFVECQRRLLAECRRVLSSDGCLFLATKNRFFLKRLAGMRDDHAYGIRFGNTLPRWLLKGLLRLKGKTGPEGVLHSYGALRRMLRSAGFGHIDPWWAIPDARHPRMYRRLDTSSIRQVWQAGELTGGGTRYSRFLSRWCPAPLVPRFTRSLVFLAYKGDGASAHGTGN